MIGVGANRYVHWHDLVAEIPGREDPVEDRYACIEYLARRQRMLPKATSESARKGQAEIAAALVRVSIAGRDRESEAERQLAEAHRAIDRLLAFVPARAAAVPEQRMQELARELVAVALRAAPRDAQVSAYLSPEADIDTDACHRMVISVALDSRAEVSLVATVIESVHRRFAELASPAERIAVRLLVEPEFRGST